MPGLDCGSVTATFTLSTPPTYEQRLDECLDVVKESIMAAPKGAEFKIVKTESGNTISTDPLLIFEMKVGLR